MTEDEHPARYVTLDDRVALELAREDPNAFVAGDERLAIDEVQRAPDLLLAIKQVVDLDPTPGRFLLTGSADIMTHPRIADALPGRVDYMTLWPFSQSELTRRVPSFLEKAFAGKDPAVEDPPIGREGYAELLIQGGFPEAVGATAARRRRFFASYADSDSGSRDRRNSAPCGIPARHRGSSRLAAARSAALTNLSAIGRELGIDHKTVGNHLHALEQLFLLIRLPAWHANLGHRLVRSAKLHIADTGMLCSLIGVDAKRLVEDGTLAGSVFETFAVTELIKQADAGQEVVITRRGRPAARLAPERRPGTVLRLPRGRS